jgi:hypothetical protein
MSILINISFESLKIYRDSNSSKKFKNFSNVYPVFYKTPKQGRGATTTSLLLLFLPSKNLSNTTQENIKDSQLHKTFYVYTLNPPPIINSCFF